MGKPTTRKKTERKSSTTTKKIKAELKRKPEKEKVNKTISFGSTLVDVMVGGGTCMGVPGGKIVNIVGDKSAGKTFLCTEAVAATRDKYSKEFEHNYDDGEDGYTFDTKKLYGFDVIINKENQKKNPDKKETLKSRIIENFDTNVQTFTKKRAKKNGIGLYVLDSLDGLSTDEKEKMSEDRLKKANKGETPANEGTYDTVIPKFLSQHFFKERTRDLTESNTTLFIVSQVRDVLNSFAFGKKTKRNGGKALDFYCWAVIWLSTIHKIKKKGKTVGVVVKASLDKSKTPRPFRTCEFIFYFDYGIDDIGTSLNYLYKVWGDKGLNASSKNIPWDGGKDKTIKNIKEFLEKNEVIDNYRRKVKKDKGKNNIILDHSIEWILSKEELNKKFLKEFPEGREYEELCTAIDEDSKLLVELKKRVIDKWELSEAEVATKRKRKYS